MKDGKSYKSTMGTEGTDQKYVTVDDLLSPASQKEMIPYASVPTSSYSINEEIARRENIRNKSLEQDINLKRNTLFVLFLFLGIETIVIFAFSFFQGTKAWGFQLEEWSFKLLISATLLQITYMLQVAVKHLFPDKKEEVPKTPEEK